ncbi:hypothetical protein BC828DRAFT_385926 [Blastocladiella britannica]|nr:hypothetical protein BC828DRAFT_385926 [Blastocladiella britannica]
MSAIQPASPLQPPPPPTSARQRRGGDEQRPPTSDAIQPLQYSPRPTGSGLPSRPARFVERHAAIKHAITEPALRAALDRAVTLNGGGKSGSSSASDTGGLLNDPGGGGGKNGAAAMQGGGQGELLPLAPIAVGLSRSVSRTKDESDRVRRSTSADALSTGGGGSDSGEEHGASKLKVPPPTDVLAMTIAATQVGTVAAAASANSPRRTAGRSAAGHVRSRSTNGVTIMNLNLPNDNNTQSLAVAPLLDPVVVVGQAAGVQPRPVTATSAAAAAAPPPASPPAITIAVGAPQISGPETASLSLPRTAATGTTSIEPSSPPGTYASSSHAAAAPLPVAGPNPAGTGAPQLSIGSPPRSSSPARSSSPITGPIIQPSRCNSSGSSGNGYSGNGHSNAPSGPSDPRQLMAKYYAVLSDPDPPSVTRAKAAAAKAAALAAVHMGGAGGREVLMFPGANAVDIHIVGVTAPRETMRQRRFRSPSYIDPTPHVPGVPVLDGHSQYVPVGGGGLKPAVAASRHETGAHSQYELNDTRQDVGGVSGSAAAAATRDEYAIAVTAYGTTELRARRNSEGSFSNFPILSQIEPVEAVKREEVGGGLGGAPPALAPVETRTRRSRSVSRHQSEPAVIVRESHKGESGGWTKTVTIDDPKDLDIVPVIESSIVAASESQFAPFPAAATAAAAAGARAAQPPPSPSRTRRASELAKPGMAGASKKTDEAPVALPMRSARPPPGPASILTEQSQGLGPKPVANVKQIVLDGRRSRQPTSTSMTTGAGVGVGGPAPAAATTNDPGLFLDAMSMLSGKGSSPAPQDQQRKQQQVGTDQVSLTATTMMTGAAAPNPLPDQGRPQTPAPSVKFDTSAANDPPPGAFSRPRASSISQTPMSRRASMSPNAALLLSNPPPTTASSAAVDPDALRGALMINQRVVTDPKPGWDRPTSVSMARYDDDEYRGPMRGAHKFSLLTSSVGTGAQQQPSPQRPAAAGTSPPAAPVLMTPAIVRPNGDPGFDGMMMALTVRRATAAQLGRLPACVAEAVPAQETQAEKVAARREMMEQRRMSAPRTPSPRRRPSAAPVTPTEKPKSAPARPALKRQTAPTPALPTEVDTRPPPLPEQPTIVEDTEPPTPPEPVEDPFDTAVNAMLDRFSPRLTAMDHTQRFAFVTDYARLMKRHEDYTTKTLVNNNMSTLDVDTRKVDHFDDDALFTMMWNLYFFIRSMGREFTLPQSTRQMLARLVCSGEEDAVKRDSIKTLLRGVPKDQFLNYKAVIGHSFRMMQAATSSSLESPLALVIGSLVFHTRQLPPVKPKSFLDAIKKKEFKTISPVGSVDSLDSDSTSDTPAPVSATPRRKSLRSLATSASELGSLESVTALKSMNPEDAEEGSIFSAAVGTDEVVGMMADSEVVMLREQMAKVMKSMLRGEPAALPEEGMVMLYLAQSFDYLY